MKPKIAILIHSMAGGGAQRFVSHLINSLDDDLEIHLLVFEDTLAYELPDNLVIKVIDDGNTARGNLLNIARIPLMSFRLLKYCKKNNIGLLLSFLNRPNLTACFTKLIGLKIPLLISERIYTPIWFKEDNFRGKIAKHLVSWLYPLADAILPNSQGTRQALENHYGVVNKYFVIKNIVDLEDIDIKRHEEVDDVQFDRFTYVYVARFSPQKNHQMLIKAFSRLGNKNAQLLLIGKNYEYDKLFNTQKEVEELVNTLGLKDKVLILGHKSNPFKYLDRADCFVLASDFEGFPNVLTEAMACGLPIISTDCLTGPRELLAPESGDRTQITGRYEIGQFGVLVPVNDEIILAAAMKEMMDNQNLRTSYKASIRGVAEKYDRGIVIEDLKRIIDQFLPLVQDNR